jgi:hypothetical protein
MADMGTVEDTAVTGVTDAVRKRPAKELSSRWQWPQHPMPRMAAHALHQKANGTGTGADVSSIESRS